MKYPKNIPSLLPTLLLISTLFFSGCGEPRDTDEKPSTEATPEKQPSTPQAEPAETAESSQTAFRDSPEVVHETGFDAKDTAWNSWFPEGQGLAMAYDAEVGATAPGALRADQVFRGMWLRSLALQPGYYRVRAKVRASGEGFNEIGLAARPLKTLEQGGTGALGQAFFPNNLLNVSGDTWQDAELVFLMPQDGVVDGELVSAIELMFNTRTVSGSAWMDDLVVEKLHIPAPYLSTFSESLGGWIPYVRPGLEVQGEIQQKAHPGLVDPGILVVRFHEGRPGMAAALDLSIDALGAAKRWTLSAAAKGDGGALPGLSVVQLDAEGKVLTEDAGAPLKEAGWNPLDLTFDLREDTAAVRLLAANFGEGEALFDHLLLRPSLAGEKPLAVSAFPVRVGIYPADVIAALSGSEASITTPSGQASAVGIALWGRKDLEGNTVVEVEIPEWLEFLTAEQGQYGKEPLQPEVRKGDDGRQILRFTNPYDWAKLMMGEMPNHYTHLLFAFRANAPAGTEGVIRLSVAVGDVEGEVRDVPLLVRPTIESFEKTIDFTVGMWTNGDLNLLDPAARRALLTTYATAGFKQGQFRVGSVLYDRALPDFAALGLEPVLTNLAVAGMIGAYPKDLQTEENFMRLVDGKTYPNHIAIGLALEDPKMLEAYRTFVKNSLAGMPPGRKFVSLDLEFWGKSGTNTAYFHPATIALFRKQARLGDDVELTPETITTRYLKQWQEFRLWAYGRAVALAAKTVREFEPEARIYNYDYPLDPGGREPEYVTRSPMSALRAAPFVDGHLTSTYSREGANYFDALENTIPFLKRSVIPIPFLMKELGMANLSTYNYRQLSAPEYRFQVVVTAACGGHGINGYPGKLLDADFLQALRDGLEVVHRHGAFYTEGKRTDDKIKLLTENPSLRHTVHTLGDRHLLSIFNGGSEPLEVRYEIDGEAFERTIQARDFFHQEWSQ